MESQIISSKLIDEIRKGETDYSDEKVQAFIPIALKLTDFDFLDLIAKNDFSKDYETIHHFLGNVQFLMEEILVRSGYYGGR